MGKRVTVTLPEELHTRLEAEAERRQMTPAEVIEQALEALATNDERAVRAHAAFGAAAHLPGSVDEFLQLKQEEIDREEERWQRRQAGRA